RWAVDAAGDVPGMDAADRARDPHLLDLAAGHLVAAGRRGPGHRPAGDRRLDPRARCAVRCQPAPRRRPAAPVSDADTMTLMQTRAVTDREPWVRGSAAEAAARPLTPRGVLRAAKESGGLAFSIPPVAFVLIPISLAWLRAPGPAAALVTVMLL